MAPDLSTVAAQAGGLDGRRVRKLVFEALSMRLETVLDPARLTVRDLAAAATAVFGQDLADQKGHAHAQV
ncbi:MAG: hypothetical protein ACRDOH_21630 [Streptosporangiaceae bacterium]